MQEKFCHQRLSRLRMWVRKQDSGQHHTLETCEKLFKNIYRKKGFLCHGQQPINKSVALHAQIGQGLGRLAAQEIRLSLPTQNRMQNVTFTH